MLHHILPKPIHAYSTIPNNTTLNYNNQNNQIVSKKIPTYGNRENYIPRELEDYGDGGAFPEIHIKQYPLNMGRKNNSLNSKTVSLKVDVDGKVDYNAILREGMRKDQIVHSRYKDLKPKLDIEDRDLLKPTSEEQAKEVEETAKALELIVKKKLTTACPRNRNENENVPEYIRYTPGGGGGIDGHNSGAKSRMIKLYNMPVDPLEPPKFKHKKLPMRPPSPPVPIMHSPPRTITIEDQKNWKIPPCISNWKNNKGFTMPLDQRLAADGRGLHNHTINDGFAKFSEALLIAERTARQEVEARAKIKIKIAKKQKEQNEAELAKMAQIAKDKIRNNDKNYGENIKNDNKNDKNKEINLKAREERDAIRREREREIKRDYRLQQKKSKNKKNISVRERERDISEIIALGEFNNKNKEFGSNDSLFDRRLFNQTSGLNQGFENDDHYNIYDKPLFNSKSSKIYRPKNNNADINNRIDNIIKKTQGFEVNENNNNKNGNGPFEFVKDNDSDYDDYAQKDHISNNNRKRPRSRSRSRSPKSSNRHRRNRSTSKEYSTRDRRDKRRR